MIGGIFETIGKTIGLGKEKYFLELDDAAEKGVKNLKSTASKAAKATVETAKDVSAEVVSKVQSATDETADKARAAADKGKNKAKKAANKEADQRSAQPASSENGAASDSPEPSAQSQPRSAEEIIVSAIAAASKKTDSEGNAVDDSPTNFATDYLMPAANGSRRRPGPSFASFKGMAKEVNPRLRG
ncbi:hypothetical protein [Leptolyngbya sp. BC1307]|uniref:hypothetical protein n=1 Tax=Leptolyngbya sp. BC1307 TaxID=2029589 RepID=UPI000EFA5C14|nr:hypothetical protein [Leptolyngbya sp. BC1307]